MKVSEDEKKNQIGLSLIEGVGDKIGKKLLAYFGSVKVIFLSSKSDLEKVDGIGSFQRWQMNCYKQNLKI